RTARRGLPPARGRARPDREDGAVERRARSAHAAGAADRRGRRMMQARTVTLDRIESGLRQAGLLTAGAAQDIAVSGIADDSREVSAGDLFCAWAGTSSDSHDYIPAAAEKGAVAALVERRVKEAPLPQITVTDGRRAAAVAASIYYGSPEQALRIAGVTGTNGKTTSVWVLRHMLSQREPTDSLGTLGTILEDGSTLPGSESRTPPGPGQLARTLRLLVDRGVRCLAMEVSSHALAQGRVHALQFDVAIFTNLSRDHLDYHGTIETYLGAKRSLVTLLKRTGAAVINADDTAWDGLAREAPQSLTFGIDHQADVTATDIDLRADGSRFVLRMPDGTAAVHLPLLGRFNIENALGAAAACLALGFTVRETAHAVATIPQVPGRLERISDSPCPVLRDYAHTPDALERVLSTLRPLTPGRLIVLF